MTKTRKTRKYAVFRMSHFVFLGYLASEHIKFKVNQNNILKKMLVGMEAKDEIFQIF